MKIDLFKLNNFNEVFIDEDIAFAEEYYIDSDIRDVKNFHVKGNIMIDYEDFIVTDLVLTGELILPCAVTLDDVLYPIEVKMEENIGKFEDFYNKNKNTLDILPFIWENIVTEVPIRVVKEDIGDIKLSGDGWEVVSD